MSVRFESVFVSVFEFVSPWRGFRDRKMIARSVRGYMWWEVSKSPTDSPRVRSIEVKVDESFDFNKEGKIWWTQAYGDMASAYRKLKE